MAPAAVVKRGAPEASTMPTPPARAALAEDSVGAIPRGGPLAVLGISQLDVSFAGETMEPAQPPVIEVGAVQSSLVGKAMKVDAAAEAAAEAGDAPVGSAAGVGALTHFL